MTTGGANAFEYILLYMGYISRWFNFREFRESLIAKIFTLIHVYLH